LKVAGARIFHGVLWSGSFRYGKESRAAHEKLERDLPRGHMLEFGDFLQDLPTR
jgi:hypothetical protein